MRHNRFTSRRWSADHGRISPRGRPGDSRLTKAMLAILGPADVGDYDEPHCVPTDAESGQSAAMETNYRRVTASDGTSRLEEVPPRPAAT